MNGALSVSELGESAIDKLLDVLANLRRIELPVDEVLGPSTLNIGFSAGLRAERDLRSRTRGIFIRLVSIGANPRCVACAMCGAPSKRSALHSATRQERFREWDDRGCAYNRYSGFRR
jgi:hypothetical protein